jgi:arginine decarboxylase
MVYARQFSDQYTARQLGYQGALHTSSHQSLEQGISTVNIGGISCDNADYYNSEAHINQVYLPSYDENTEEPLYIGFFHTGAYQESLSGYGGLKHCLLPAPKHVLIDKNYYGEFVDTEVFKEQDADSMLKILGY